MKNVRITSIPARAGDQPTSSAPPAPEPARPAAERVEEIGGPKGPDPTRYGDWEVGGRCIDF